MQIRNILGFLDLEGDGNSFLLPPPADELLKAVRGAVYEAVSLGYLPYKQAGDARSVVYIPGMPGRLVMLCEAPHAGGEAFSFPCTMDGGPQFKVYIKVLYLDNYIQDAVKEYRISSMVRQQKCQHVLGLWKVGVDVRSCSIAFITKDVGLSIQKLCSDPCQVAAFSLPETMLEFSFQMGLGVFEMHKATGFWHNEVTSDNVIWDGSRATLIDFGSIRQPDGGLGTGRSLGQQI